MGVSFSDRKIKAPDLYSVCAELLDNYAANVAEATDAAAKKAAEDTAKELRKAGTFNGGKEFRRGWAVQGKRIRGVGGTYTVYNKNKPGLAHLLEFGHAKAGGGRTRAFTFIAPIADTVEDRFRNAFVDVMADQT